MSTHACTTAHVRERSEHVSHEMAKERTLGSSGIRCPFKAGDGLISLLLYVARLPAPATFGARTGIGRS